MGVLDNTIIVYTTDNGPEHSAKNHGGTTPFRGEKMTTYERGSPCSNDGVMAGTYSYGTSEARYSVAYGSVYNFGECRRK